MLRSPGTIAAESQGQVQLHTSSVFFKSCNFVLCWSSGLSFLCVCNGEQGEGLHENHSGVKMREWLKLDSKIDSGYFFRVSFNLQVVVQDPVCVGCNEMWLPLDKYSVLHVMKIGTLQQFINRRNCSCCGKAKAICFSPQLLAPSRGSPHPHPRPCCAQLRAPMGMGWVVMGFDTLRQSEAELLQGTWGCSCTGISPGSKGSRSSSHAFSCPGLLPASLLMGSHSKVGMIPVYSWDLLLQNHMF